MLTPPTSPHTQTHTRTLIPHRDVPVKDARRAPHAVGVCAPEGGYPLKSLGGNNASRRLGVNTAFTPPEEGIGGWWGGLQSQRDIVLPFCVVAEKEVWRSEGFGHGSHDLSTDCIIGLRTLMLRGGGPGRRAGRGVGGSAALQQHHLSSWGGTTGRRGGNVSRQPL